MLHIISNIKLFIKNAAWKKRKEKSCIHFIYAILSDVISKQQSVSNQHSGC